MRRTTAVAGWPLGNSATSVLFLLSLFLFFRSLNHRQFTSIRTRSVDSGSPGSSLPGRPSWLFRGGSPDHYNGDQQPKPKPLTTVVGFNNHHVPGAERMRHNSTGSSPRRDNRLIDKNLIEIKGDVVIGCAIQNGLSNSVDHDVWIPRLSQRRSVERKVSSYFYLFFKISNKHCYSSC